MTVDQAAALAMEISERGRLRGDALLGHQGIVGDGAPLLEKRRDAERLAVADDVARPCSFHRSGAVAALAPSDQPIGLRSMLWVEANRADRRLVGDEPHRRRNATQEDRKSVV